MRTRSVRFQVAISIVWLCAPVSAALAEPSVVAVDDTLDPVEITVRDEEGFTVGAMPYVLAIGPHEFTRSRSPASGALDTLIFLVAPDQFALIDDADLVKLGYGKIMSDEEHTKEDDRERSARRSGYRMKRRHWKMKAFGQVRADLKKRR